MFPKINYAVTRMWAVLEVETDLADSGAQSGSVSSSWLVNLPTANCHIFQVKESGSGPLDFNVVFF